MILIPEQVKALRDKIYFLELQLEGYKEYFKSREKSGLESGFVTFTDSTMESYDYSEIEKQLEAYKKTLEVGEFLKNVDDEKVGYGTTVIVKYDDVEEEEKYTITENSIGLNSVGFEKGNSYISVESYLGKAINGLVEGDQFSYSVPIKGKRDSLLITGKIVEIIKTSNKDVNFIISRKKSCRFSKTAQKMIKSLKENNDTEELRKIEEITISQYELLKEERQKLLNIISMYKKYDGKIMNGTIIKIKNSQGKISTYQIVDKDNIDIEKEIDISSLTFSKLVTKSKGDKIDIIGIYVLGGKKKHKQYKGTIVEIDNSLVKRNESVFRSINEVYGRLGQVNKYLRNSKIVAPREDNKIGIGSKVSIMTFENGEVQNRRVEIINKAVSTELNTDYIEALSPLGQAILNADKNDKFYYYYGNARFGDGLIYDINNNMSERLAPNPLVYQKRRRG